MRTYPLTKRLPYVAILLISGALLSGCASTQGSVVKSADVAAAQVAAAPTSKDFVLIWQVYGTPTPTPTLDPVDSLTATASAKDRPTAGPITPGAAFVAATAGPGDASRGERIFSSVGTCSTCHDTSNGNTIVGPSLKGVASRAGQREPGKTADQYLHESILTPNAFVVSSFSPNIMPQNFGQLLTPQQIEDVTAYLKTLQ
ncbi:MAG: c-type cytochrome [Chloroflexota bacterium]